MIQQFICRCYCPNLSSLSAAHTEQFRNMNKALQESKAARENVRACVCLVAGLCATFPVQGTTPARCSARSWATPGAGSTRLTLQDGQQPARAKVAEGCRFRNISMSSGAGRVLLAAHRRFGTVGISAFKERGVASRAMPTVSQMWPANCRPAPLRHCQNIYRCKTYTANVRTLGVWLLL